MPASALNNLGMNYGWTLGEDGWKVGMDLNMVLSDWSLQPYLSIEFKTVTAQPGSPADGGVWLLPASPTGADWLTALTGAENDIMIFYSGFPDIAGVSSSGWIKLTPLDGWRVYDRATNVWYEFDGTGWLVDARFPVVNHGAGTLNLSGSHAGRFIRANLNGNQSVTIQDDATITLAIGTRIRFYKAGSGVLTIIEDTAVTLSYEGSSGNIDAPQFTVVDVVKHAADAWVATIASWPFAYRAIADNLGVFEPVLSDKTILLTNAYDQVGDAVNIPDEATVNYPIGHQLKIINGSGGTVNVTADMAVTFPTDSTDPVAGTFADNQILIIEKVASDTWLTLKFSAA